MQNYVDVICFMPENIDLHFAVVVVVVAVIVVTYLHK